MGRPRTRPRVCEVCSGAYEPTYSGQRTCGRDCGARLRVREGTLGSEVARKVRGRNSYYSRRRRAEQELDQDRRAGLRRRHVADYMLARYHADPDNWSTKRKRLRIFERDGWECQVCGCTVELDLPRRHPRRAVAMHVLAAATGGEWTEDNIITGCHACNVADGVNQTPIQTRLVLSF